MQVGLAFFEVNSAFSWVSESYEGLSDYQTRIERLTDLNDAIDGVDIVANPKLIVRQEKDTQNLKFKNLSIDLPKYSSTGCIMRNLNLKLTKGEHVVLEGNSGLGKSTLFKIIAGTWKYGQGEVNVPAGKRLAVIPQKPTMHNHLNLKELLAYPNPDIYRDDQYIAALKKVGSMDKFIPQLQDTQPGDWSKMSGGEQQRISFARALLQEPDWLFLDEATASLDEASEAHVYQALLDNLKDTTIVSIAHRRTVDKYHSDIIHFKVNKEKEVEITRENAPMRLA
jgi:putative ATP-binding cassette transporter